MYTYLNICDVLQLTSSWKPGANVVERLILFAYVTVTSRATKKHACSRNYAKLCKIFEKFHFELFIRFFIGCHRLYMGAYLTRHGGLAYS